MAPKIPKPNESLLNDWRANVAMDNATVAKKKIVDPIVAPRRVIKQDIANTRANISRDIETQQKLTKLNPGESVSDYGTTILNGLKTVGGSLVGDAINSVSPSSAKKVAEFTGGIIEPTSKEQYLKGREGSWGDRINMAAEGVSSVVSGELLNAATSKLAGEVGKGLDILKDKYVSRNVPIFRKAPLVTKNGNIVTTAETGTRGTTHFTYDVPVQSHKNGNWDDQMTTIVVPFKKVRKLGEIKSIEPSDLIIDGRSGLISEKSAAIIS
jgi:hypothetical protein